VTLEPIENGLEEQVDLMFSSASTGASQTDTKDDDEPPEPLVDGKLDLGAIATEFLLLGIDPYPRKAGASLDAAGPDEPVENEFQQKLRSLLRKS